MSSFVLDATVTMAWCFAGRTGVSEELVVSHLCGEVVGVRGKARG